jgi:hypothetical protein
MGVGVGVCGMLFVARWPEVVVVLHGGGRRGFPAFKLQGGKHPTQRGAHSWHWQTDAEADGVSAAQRETCTGEGVAESSRRTCFVVVEGWWRQAGHMQRRDGRGEQQQPPWADRGIRRTHSTEAGWSVKGASA